MPHNFTPRFENAVGADGLKKTIMQKEKEQKDLPNEYC